MDIVIPLKRAMNNEELRYTLCGIDKNVPHRTVWLAGYHPSWVKNVGYIEVRVPYGGKYAKAANNILTAARDPRVSDDFLLFNDDFFVMKPIERVEILHRGKLIDYIQKFKDQDMARGMYFHGLVRTYDALQSMGVKDPLNYSLHIPIEINKQKWLEMWKKRLEFGPEPIHLRTFYGNLHQIGGRQTDDVKIVGQHIKPTGEETFLSTEDSSYASGKIGEYIRQQFPRGASRYT